MKALVAILVLAVAVLGILFGFTRTAVRTLMEENQALRRQLEQSSAAQSEPAQVAVEPSENSGELIKLRGEVSELRREKIEAEKLRAENQTLRVELENPSGAARTANAPQKPVGSLPRDQWTFSGYADPEAAFQSVVWAGAAQNPAALLAGLTPEQFQRMQTEDNQNRSETEVLERLTKDIAKIKSYQVLKSDLIADHEAVLTLFVDGLEGSEQIPRLKMQKIGNDWRLAGPYRPEQSKPGN